MRLDSPVADIDLSLDHVFPLARLKFFADQDFHTVEGIISCAANPIVLTKMLMAIESISKITVRLPLSSIGVVRQKTITVRAIAENVSRFLVAHFRSVLPTPNRAKEIVFPVISPLNGRFWHLTRRACRWCYIRLRRWRRRGAKDRVMLLCEQA